MTITRKYTRKNTKNNIRKIARLACIQGFLYSYRDISRNGLEYRDFLYYLWPYFKKKIRYNKYWNNRSLLIPNSDWEKLFNTSIKEILVFNNKKSIELIKLLFCNKS